MLSIRNYDLYCFRTLESAIDMDRLTKLVTFRSPIDIFHDVPGEVLDVTTDNRVTSAKINDKLRFLTFFFMILIYTFLEYLLTTQVELNFNEINIVLKYFIIHTMYRIIKVGP